MSFKPLEVKKPLVLLKTPQSIVHIKHSVTLRQYKYWVILLKLYKDCLDSGEQPDQDGFYYVHKTKITEFLGYEPVRAELKADLRALRSEEIIINVLGKDGEKEERGMGFISEWVLSSKYIAFQIPSFLRRAVTGENSAKQIFQLLNWSIFNSFNGKYEAIIYKLCKDYLGVRRTPYMTIAEYREYIGLKGNEYSEMRDFNKRCINNPIAAINKSEITDIEVSVEFKKVGRKVEGLYFLVKERKQNSLPFPEFEPHKSFTFAKVSITLEDQHKYLSAMSPEEIEATIQRANEYSNTLKAQGKAAQLGAIYKKAFSERWGVQQLEQIKVDKQPQSDLKPSTENQPKKNISNFAGNELILFKAIHKKHPEITEKYVHHFAEESGFSLVQALEKIKSAYKAAEQFSLEKSD
jgi:hypothetical protein